MVQIYLNDKNRKKKIVEAQLIKTRKNTILVRLADGNIISRKRSKQVVEEKK